MIKQYAQRLLLVLLVIGILVLLGLVIFGEKGILKGGQTAQVAAPGISKLSLVSVTTGKAVRSFSPQGETVDLSTYWKYGSTFSIVAIVNGGVKSVKFNVNNGEYIHNENAAPFTLAGDGNNGTTYLAPPFIAGRTYSIVVTPYEGYTGTGRAGTPATITLVMPPGAPITLVPPTNVTALPGNGQVSLSWSTVPGAISYRVERSVTNNGPFTTIGTPTGTTLVNTGLTNGTTYYYVITAVAGSQQASSVVVSATPTGIAPPVDTTLPTVSITAPTANATVSNIVTITANASDNVGVTGVQFKVGSANIGSQDTSAPYSVTWNTSALPNGVHALTAVARDAAGNTKTSNAVSVTVNNQIVTTGTRWHDPATWPTGRVPVAGQHVTIDPGQEVVVDASVFNMGEVTVLGTLRFADTDLTFQTQNIFVHGNGVLEAGTAANPIQSDITIELTANPTRGFDGADPNKVIAVGGHAASSGHSGHGVPGGAARIDIHGVRAKSVQWTQLVPLSGQPGFATGGYAAGANKLKFATSVTSGAEPWRVGDTLVVAPTAFPDGLGEEGVNDIQSEVVTITAVNSDGTVNISPALAHYHHASIETVSGSGESASVDMRAEVGLLTRNIKIIGDVDDVANSRLPADNNAFGVGIMVMQGTAHAQIEGVEVRNGGQLATVGRYPIHFHLAGSVPGGYASRNAIVDSNQRCLMVHGTNGITFESNVTHNNWNHCIGIEDGNETGNIIRNNLVVKVKQMHPYGPGGDDGIFGKNWFAFTCKGCKEPNGSTISSGTQDERHVAGVWISSPNNTVEGNHVAGGVGIGFLYDVGEKPYGTTAKYDRFNSPYKMDAATGGIFRNNLAHSFADWGSYASGTTNLSDRSDYLTSGMGFFVDDMDVGTSDADGKMIFENFTTYANEVMGIWIESEGTVVRNFTIAESGSGYNIYRSTVENSVYIRDIDVPAIVQNRDYGAVNLASGTDQQHSEKEPRINGLKIFNQTGSPSIFVQGRRKSEATNTLDKQRVGVFSYLKGIKFINSPAWKFQYQQDSVDAAIADVDGSVTGGQNFIVSSDYHSCTLDRAFNAKLCPLNAWSALNIYTDFIAGSPIGDIVLTEPAPGTNRTMFKTDTFESSWMTGYDEERSELVAANQTYEVTFNSGVPAQSFNLRFKGYNSDRGHIIKIKNMTSAPSSVKFNNSTVAASTSASSLGYAADGYHYDSTSKVLTIAVRLNSASDYAKVVRVNR